MRITWILLISFLFAVSCKPVYIVGHRPTPVTPFVLLKDSTRITAKEVGQEDNFGRARIIADDKAFERKDVASYSNGEQMYVNRKGSFLPLVATGSINVYSSSDGRAFGYQEGGIGEQLYLQNKQNGKLEYFGYKSLRRNIAPGEPGYDVLKRYKTTRTILKLTMLGGLACFVAGAVIAGDGVTQDKDAKVDAGMRMIFGGMGLIACTTIPIFTNKFKLRRALAIHNGVYHEL